MEQITENSKATNKKRSTIHKNRNRPVKLFKRIGLGIVLLFILALVAEPVLSACGADNFFTLAAVPVGSAQQTTVYQKVFGDDTTYARARNFRGEYIFKNPAAAFAKMEKECSPLLEEMQKEEHLPAFSTTTYRKYLNVFGQPPAYIPHDETKYSYYQPQFLKVYHTCTIYLNSTQLLFGPQKSQMDSSK